MESDGFYYGSQCLLDTSSKNCYNKPRKLWEDFEMKTTLRSARKSLVLLLLLFLLVGMLIACNSSPSGDETSESAESTGEGTSESVESTETDETDQLFRIVENGVGNFTIVASEDSTQAEINAYIAIRNGIFDLTGVSLPLSSDWIRPGEEHDSNSYEILVGQTNYTQSQEVLNETSYGSYTIAVVDNKIVLNAWSDVAIEAGAETLVQILGAAVSDGNLLIESDRLSATEIVDTSLDYIPVVPNLKIDHIYDANGAFEAIYEKATQEHFDEYVAKLEKDGYTKYAENVRGNVSSVIFTDGKDYTYNIFYEGGYRQLCVLIEDYNVKMLPPKNTSYTKVCDTKFAQVGVEYLYTPSLSYSNVQNGMCYIWRLEDGRFLIMDGGFNYKMGADNLYNALREMAVDPDNIVIASWIISHFHGDHVGTLVNFVKNYLYDVKIESLLFNLPTEQQSSLDGMTWGSWNSIKTLVKGYYKDIVVYKAHPGQIYHFANAAVEILYTLEMTAPDDLVYYNTCSLITNVSFGDFDMLMLGDCSEVTNSNLRANYGEALRSEVVQVAHHGYQGGSTALYKLINPLYVFWPAGTIWQSTCVTNASDDIPGNRNAYFVMSGTNIRYTFVAKNDVVVLTVKKDTGFTDYTVYDDINAMVAESGTSASIK